MRLQAGCAEGGGAPLRRRDVCRAASAFLLPRRFPRTPSPPGSGQVGPASPGCWVQLLGVASGILPLRTKGYAPEDLYGPLRTLKDQISLTIPAHRFPLGRGPAVIR
ncbi:unnamed protein product [Arctogadus glacialis]